MVKHAYIHIPFCVKKCHYCSFVSGFDISLKDKYISALIKEIKYKYNSDLLNTIYFGGGTPSVLNPNDIYRILNCFNFNSDTEITIEANPESVSYEKFVKYKEQGINRVSLGVQTFDNYILKLIGRAHDEKQIYSAIETILNAGFTNISIDLIYGLPTQSLKEFKKDLKKAISTDIKHISTYGLKIEENSYFYDNPPQTIPDEESQAQCYLYLCDFLKENNFEHYEISNFSLKGYESKHNLCYWKNKNYYGFGLNASGYENSTRYKNISDMEKYINNPLTKEEIITLSDNQIKEEEIFLALRLKEGINTNKLKSEHFEIIEKYKQQGLIEEKNKHVNLTEKGFLLSNEIMSEFID